MERKASAIEWIVLILGIICFGGGIYLSFLSLPPLYAVGAFTLSLLLVLVFTIFQPKSDAKLQAEFVAECQGRVDEANGLAAKTQIDLDAAQAEVSALRQQLEALDSQNSQTMVELTELKEKAQKATEKPRTVLFNEALLEEKTEFDLKVVAEDTLQRMKIFADQKNIRCTLTCPDKVAFVGSEKLLGIMMRNIVDNAIKYMKRPGSLHLTLSEVGGDIFMIFKDDGLGLSASELPYIFDLNFQGSNRVSGNGLGLTQARDIVVSYDGVIYAKSAPGEGMGIYVQLPTGKEKEKEYVCPDGDMQLGDMSKEEADE